MGKPERRHEINKPLLQALAKVVREERLKQGLTQEELARRSGIHWRYLQEIEAGVKEGAKLKNVSLSMFFALAGGLKISPSNFVDSLSD